MAIELIPDLTTACVEVSTGPGELCVRFPGGVALCASMQATETGDAGEIAKDMLGQVGSALMPLQPFFNLLDVIKAMFDCLQAVPDAITQLDVGGLVACVPDMQKAVDKVLALVPPVPILQLVKDALGVIIVALQGIRAKLAAMIRQSNRIAAASVAATQFNSPQLQIVVDCANANMAAQLQNMNAAMGPLNRLIGVLNILLELAGQECIGALAGFGEVSEAVLEPLDASIEVLQVIQMLIPTANIALPGLPSPGGCP